MNWLGSAGQVAQRLAGTAEHPFFVEGGGTVPLGQLGIGTSVVTRAGPPLVVKTLRREVHARGVTVYNFEVAEAHTYFVGTAHGGTWVHNDCLDRVTAAGATRRTRPWASTCWAHATMMPQRAGS